MNGQSITQTYISRIRPRANDELSWFRQQPTLSEALRVAGLAINSKGKRYSHQRRLSKNVLEQARDLLLTNEERIAQCNSFDKLFLLLESFLAPVKGLGELYIYDTAFRVSAKLRILPTKVYLHAGTRVGARALGFDGRAKTLEVAQLPDWLHSLEAYEIEDVLCIFKDRLTQAKARADLQDLPKESWCD